MARDISALKAVSQNLIHSNISNTDRVYRILSDNDVRGQIIVLGKQLLPNEVAKIEEFKTMKK